MIHDTLLCLDLPAHLGPPLPTRPLEGLENLLFTGRWATRRATTSVSTAAMLARGLAALRELEFGEVHVTDDAGTVLDQAVASLPGDGTRWPEALPPTWTEQPCALTVRAARVGDGVRAVATLRLTPRYEPAQAPLAGSLRTLWDVGPGSGDEQTFGASFHAALRDERALRELCRRLTARGAVLAEGLLTALKEAFPHSDGTHWGRLLVLHGYGAQPGRFADLLAGVPEERRHHLALLEARLAESPSRWPALDAAGVPGWVHRGRFVPDAEVLHVA
jgi:hypothetical protein